MNEGRDLLNEAPPKCIMQAAESCLDSFLNTLGKGGVPPGFAAKATRHFAENAHGDEVKQLIYMGALAIAIERLAVAANNSNKRAKGKRAI